MAALFLRGVISAAIVVGVSLLSQRYPRWGALLLTLPIISILAFVMSWQQSHDLRAISRLARETLILVPLGLPFFVPLALSEKLNIGFWLALTMGVIAAAISIGGWLITHR